jgi:endonuclease III
MLKNKIVFINLAIPLLKEKYPESGTDLHYKEPWQLAVAVILSAQCTDVRVNMVTPALFKAYHNARKLAECVIEELEILIFSTGFYHNKAKNIKAFCKNLIENHKGIIPDSMDELTKMPGIGRKTANVLLQSLYNIPSGITVDTHVIRLSKLMGLTTHSDAVKIEKDLMKIIPVDSWIDWSWFMIRLGRSVCPARKPDCKNCVLKEICYSSSVRACMRE